MKANLASKVWVAALIALIVSCVPMVAWAVDAADESALETGLVSTQATSSTTPDGAFTKQKVNMKVNTVSGETIANGTYIIASANNAQMLVGIGSSKNNASIKLKKQNGTKYQMWNFYYNNVSNTYEITSALTGKSLTTDGVNLYQYDLGERGTDRSVLKQRWIVTATSKGYTITSAYNKDLSLSVEGTKTAKVELAANKATNSQRFWIFSTKKWTKTNIIKNGTYVLKTRKGSLLLESKTASTASMQPFRVNKKSEKDVCQMFDISFVKKGLYKIENVGTSQALCAVGSKVVQGKFRGKSYQLWEPILNDDGSVTFKNKARGTVLDITGGKAVKRKEARTSKLKDEPTVSQKWYLSPTTTGMNALVKRAYVRVNQQPSKTNYSIAVDLTAHQLMIFKRNNEKSSWIFDRQWIVTSGANKATLQWIGEKSRYQYTNDPDKGYSCYYWSRMGGHQYFHSIIYSPGTFSVSDGRLGMWVSNGCVRMALENAKYIYEQIPTYTCVQRYY